MRPAIVLLLLAASCQNAGTKLFETSFGSADTKAPAAPTLPPLRPGCYALRDDLPHLVTTLPGALVFPDAPGSQACAAVAPRSPRCLATKLADGRVELRLKDFDAVRAEQEQSQWCWAACVQMVHAYQGVKLAAPAANPGASQQSLLVSHFTNAGGDEGGTLSVILRALNPDLEERLRALGPSASLALEIPSSDDLVESLLDGLPAIVGLEFDGRDHALVVRALTLRALPAENAAHEVALDVFGNSFLGRLHERYRICSIQLQDPARADFVRTLDGEELKLRCKLIVTPERSRHALQLVFEDKRKSGELGPKGAGISLGGLLGSFR